MLARPGVLLRVEGAVLFVVSLGLYREFGASWGMFLLLILWPDLAMLGYLLNVRVGASLYNLVHLEALPLALAAVSLGQQTALSNHISSSNTGSNNTALPFALIWLAHIGMDRAVGYGLKYPTTFKDTHLQRLG